MTGFELVEKIQNKEIKSGQRIRLHSDFMNGYDIDMIFHGNWFSRDDWDETIAYKDISLHLFDKGCTYEIIEEPKKIERLETYEISSASHYDNESTLLEKINEIIDYINKGQE